MADWRDELDDLLALESGLTDWEVGFIDSIDLRRDLDRPMSTKQIAMVRQVWDRRCGSKT